MITNIQTNLNRHNKNQISFKSGKVDLYSDFDCTYFPRQQKHIKQLNPQVDPALFQYFDKFGNFLNNTRNGLKFHTTSGRTFGEFETIVWQIKESGFKMPLPDTFIAKNGSDEYIRVGTDKEFYQNGKFPFQYKETNKEKENILKSLTKWDGVKLKSKLKELLKEYNFNIIEHDSENNVNDYGYKSLFYHIKSDDFHRENNAPPRSEWVAGLRNDGNLKIYLSYPYDMQYVPERKVVFSEIDKKIKDFLIEGNVQCAIDYKNNECCKRPVIIYTPKMDESYKYAEASKEADFTLTKLYDTKEAVTRAKKNNDLVIIAGDSINDFNMLNPGMYLDFPKKTPEELIMAKTNPLNFMKILQNESTKEVRDEIIKQIEDLPFVGIVVKNKEKTSSLSQIVTAYGNGRFPCIIEVEQENLEDGIRQAIKMYADKNPKYAKMLSSDLKKEILGIVEKSGEGVAKKSKLTPIVIGVGLAAVIGGEIYHISKKKGNEGGKDILSTSTKNS